MTAPPPVPQPRFKRFLDERRLTLRDAATALGTTHETVRRICLPFGDPNRRLPKDELMARIVAWTDGAVRPADFFPPELSVAA